MGIKLHVDNLSPLTTDDDLLARFCDYADVDAVAVARNARTGMSEGIALLEMPDDREAQAAIDWLHLSRLKGRSISVYRVPALS